MTGGSGGARPATSRAAIASGLPALLFLSLAVQVALPSVASAGPTRAEVADRGTLRIVSEALARVVRTLLHAETRIAQSNHPRAVSDASALHDHRPAAARLGAIRPLIGESLLNLPPPVR